MKISYVIFHPRKKFYGGKDIYWYEFIGMDLDLVKVCEYDGHIPEKFLRVPETKYYEYGGSHAEAIADLTKTWRGSSIIEGDEI